MKVLISILSVFTGAVLISCGQNQIIPDAKPQIFVLKPVADAKKMVKIQGGTYETFIGKDTGRMIKVESFYMDDSPVTNSEYLIFLKKNPQWARSKVLRLYADSTYLKHWKNDYEIPENLDPEAPVTNVSWFAAEAYAQSVGKRLPTIDEWEYVGLADQNSRNASKNPQFTDYVLKSYQKKDKTRQLVKHEKPNYYGIYNMYGMVWEWTYDFNSVMMSGESRKDNTTNENLFCAGAAVTSSDLRNYAAFVRYALRGSLKANYCLNNLGFRCAKDYKNFK